MTEPTQANSGAAEGSAASSENTGQPQKRAHLTVSPDEFRQGKLCSCEACVRDGQHEPDCPVHDEPIGACTCNSQEQREAAG